MRNKFCRFENVSYFCILILIINTINYMRKIALILITATFSLLMASCLKDGKNDFAGLHAPLHLVGDFDPNIGLPVGGADVSLGDLLGMFGNFNGWVELDQNEVVTIVYDTSIDFHVNVASAKDTAHLMQKTFVGDLDIDLFNNLEGLPNEENLKMDDIIMTLGASLSFSTENRQHLMELMEHYGVQATVDQVAVKAVSSNGLEFDIPVLVGQEVTTANLVDGQYLRIFENYDVSNIINTRPVAVKYAFRLTLAVGTQMFNIDPTQFMIDSLMVDAFDVHTDANLRFPMNLFVNGLQYDVNMGFAPTLNLDTIPLDSSSLILEFNNRLPVEMNVGFTLMDSNDHELISLFEHGVETIAGADIAYNPVIGSFTATKSANSRIVIPVTKERIDALKRAKSIRMHTSASTSPDNVDHTPKPVVAIKGTDHLGVRIYMQLHPNLSIDIPLSGNGGRSGK